MDIDPEGGTPHDSTPAIAAPFAPVVSQTKRTPPQSGNHRRYIPFALLGVLTVGAGVAAYVAVRGDATPSQAVASAVTHSLQLKSAALKVAVGIGESGGTAAIRSEGATNFDTGATNQTLQIIAGNQHISEHIVSDGAKIYIHLDGGAIAKLVAGKSWVSVSSGRSTTSSSAVGGGATNSAVTLRALSATSDDVTDLGSARLNGATVHLYSVHLTRSQIKRTLSRERLPRFLQQSAAGLNLPAITYTLAIDSANVLTELKGTEHLKAGGQTILEHFVENFSHYGTPVTVKTPPPSEVISLQRFLQIAAEKGSNVTI